MSDDDGVILGSITITRRLHEESETYSVDYVGDIHWVNALGLLEAAKFDLYERCKTDE